jgi:hypothetical protein
MNALVTSSKKPILDDVVPPAVEFDPTTLRALGGPTFVYAIRARAKRRQWTI